MTEFEHIKYYCDNGSVTYDPTNNVLYYNNQRVDVCIKPDNYTTVRIANKTVPIHRVIAYLKYGDAYCYPVTEARHLNNNKSDYSWDNIAIGTHKQNMHDLPQEFWDGLHTEQHLELLHRLGTKAAKERYWGAMTTEQRSDKLRQMALKREAGMSDELKSERSRKGWLKKSAKSIGQSISEAHKRRDELDKADPISFYNQRNDNELTIDQVYEIAELQRTGNYRYVDLAAMYGVHYNTIEKIINRKSRYKYIPKGKQ